MATKVIVLDFDNCIALDAQTGEGSEEIKDHAWFEVFSEYGVLELDFVIERAKKEIAGGKGDREHIATRVLEKFEFPKDQIPGEAARRCQLFNTIVQRHILEMGVPPAVTTALEMLSRTYPLYINTATPQSAMTQTVHALGLKCFKGVYGRPMTKIENLRSIATAERIRHDEILLVGDSQSDHSAAKRFNCRFVGIWTRRNTAWHTTQPFPVIRSLSALETVI